MAHSITTYCSHNSRDVSLENPIGSASGIRRCFLLEVPLPWSRVPLDTPHIPEPIRAALSEYQEQHGKTAVTLLAPDPSYAVDGARLIELQVTDGRIERREFIAADSDVAPIILALAKNQPLPQGTTIDATPWRDIAVCTHGSRDVCCATFGFPMYLKMHTAAASLAHTRVWRSSHLGGHRFAPTMIDYSCGRSWGLVDDSAAKAILHRDADAATIMSHYRGWIGHKDAEVQLLEATAFAEVGWSWVEWQQSGKVLERDSEGRGVVVEIIATHPVHGEIRVSGKIAWGESFVTIASCNAEPVEYTRKVLTNHDLTALAAVSAD